MIREAMIPKGISFCGFFASSAAVETESKPIYVKKMIAPPEITPANPEGANGCQFVRFTSMPPTTRNVTMAPIFTSTMTLLAPADSRMPHTNRTVRIKTIRKAGTLKEAPDQWPPGQTGEDQLSGMWRPKEASCAFRYPPNPTATATLLTAYSKIRSQTLS